MRQKQPGKGNSWWIFINDRGRRKSKKIGDKKAAEAVAAKIREKLKLGDLNIKDDHKTPIFKDYAAQWFRTPVKVFCKYSTMKLQETYLTRHIIPVFGPTPIDEIRRKDVKEFLFAKLAEGLAPATVMNIKACLSGVYTSAVEDELVTSNPVARLGKHIKKMAEKKEPGNKIDPFTRGEAQIFLETARQYCPSYYPALARPISSRIQAMQVSSVPMSGPKM